MPVYSAWGSRLSPRERIVPCPRPWFVARPMPSAA
jgi:hypothetical protein